MTQVIIILLSNSCFMSSNSGWTRTSHCKRPSVFSQAVQTLPPSQALLPLGDKVSFSMKSEIRKPRCKGNNEQICNKISFLVLSKLYCLTGECGYTLFPLHLVSFTVLCLSLLDCRTMRFYSCFTGGEHFQIRILKTGKYLCFFWELSICWIILTDSRGKKEDSGILQTNILWEQGIFCFHAIHFWAFYSVAASLWSYL